MRLVEKYQNFPLLQLVKWTFKSKSIFNHESNSVSVRPWMWSSSCSSELQLVMKVLSCCFFFFFFFFLLLSESNSCIKSNTLHWRLMSVREMPRPIVHLWWCHSRGSAILQLYVFQLRLLQHIVFYKNSDSFQPLILNSPPSTATPP